MSDFGGREKRPKNPTPGKRFSHPLARFTSFSSLAHILNLQWYAHRILAAPSDAARTHKNLTLFSQAKRTKKVGIVGKYGTRYGASLRKQVKKIEITQHATYTCQFCGKVRPSGCMPPLITCCTYSLLLGCRPPSGRWYLALRSLPQDRCWWCLDFDVRSVLRDARFVAPDVAPPFRTTAAATVRSTVRRLRELATPTVE